MRRLTVAFVVTAVVLAGCGSANSPATGPTAGPVDSSAASPSSASDDLIGALNPAVTVDTVDTTICVPGWTKTVRPSSSYTSALKRRQLPPGADPEDYEEDHLMPLALGGAPRDERNLRPVPWPRARKDDREENRLHRAVCDGRTSLRAAQVEMSRIKDGEDS